MLFLLKANLKLTRPIAISRVRCEQPPTDRRTDQPTDQPTNRVAYRVAGTRLKRKDALAKVNFDAWLEKKSKK